MDAARLLDRIARGHVANIAFSDFARLLAHLGFVRRRMSGSHRVYAHPSCHELVNIQEVDGKVKAYQVRQVRRMIERYNLKLEAEP